MHVMLTNLGPTPLPIGTPDAGGVEGLLPPGLEIAIARDDVTSIVFGEQPIAAGRKKRNALGVDPDSPLAIEYGTNIDQWKGRSDDIAETAEMPVTLMVRNVGWDDVTITTTEGDTTFAPGEGGMVQTMAGTKLASGDGTEPPPFVPVTISITDFTATNPANVLADTTGLVEGDKVRLTATAGNPASMTVVTGSLVTVTGLTPTGFTAIGLNLLPNDVTGLTATGATEVAP